MKDVRQIQLAKGALYASCKLMMERMGIEKLDTVKIAGAFKKKRDKANWSCRRQHLILMKLEQF